MDKFYRALTVTVVVTRAVDERNRVIIGNLQRVGPGTFVQANPGEQQGDVRFGS